MVSPTDSTHALANFAYASHFQSFDMGTANGPYHTPDFTFDDFLAPATVERYFNEGDPTPDLSADLSSLGPSSSPLSTRSDIGAFFDWSIAESTTKKQGRVLRAHGTENGWVPSGGQFGPCASLAVGIISSNLTAGPSNGQPTTGKFAGQSK
jgi:hypothetical protein